MCRSSPPLLAAVVALALAVAPGARADERVPEVFLQAHMGLGFTLAISAADWNRGDVVTQALWFGGPGLGVWVGSRPAEQTWQYDSPLFVLRGHHQVGYLSIGHQLDLGAGAYLRRGLDRLFLHGGVTTGMLAVHYYGVVHLGGYAAGGWTHRGPRGVEVGFELKISVNATAGPVAPRWRLGWYSVVDVHPSTGLVILFGGGPR